MKYLFAVLILIAPVLIAPPVHADSTPSIGLAGPHAVLVASPDVLAQQTIVFDAYEVGADQVRLGVVHELPAALERSASRLDRLLPDRDGRLKLATINLYANRRYLTGLYGERQEAISMRRFPLKCPGGAA